MARSYRTPDAVGAGHARDRDALWCPSASLETIKARAELYGTTRAFFLARGVMEVDTPVLSVHATVDRHIESMQTTDARWLQTSPEFAMKRLLCAGSGPIFQIAPVFRAEEAGRFHNPEFRLLEWYRPGWDHLRLMDEVEALVCALVELPEVPFERLTYREAFVRHVRLDPFSDSLSDIQHCTLLAGFRGVIDDRDQGLDVLMSLLVGPRLGLEGPIFLHDFPASQSALARIRPGDPPVAERFELFWKGLELANGFHELSDATEQRTRFESDQNARRRHGQRVPPFDAHLIAALAHGLPDCAGVALGLDRVLMLKLGLTDVASTMAFAWDRA